MSSLFGTPTTTKTSTSNSQSGTTQNNLWGNQGFQNFLSGFSNQAGQVGNVHVDPSAATGDAATAQGSVAGGLGAGMTAANTIASGGGYGAGSYQPFMANTQPVTDAIQAQLQTALTRAGTVVDGQSAAQGALGNSTNANARREAIAPLLQNTQAQLAGVNLTQQQNAQQNAQAAGAQQLQGIGQVGNLAGAATGANTGLANIGNTQFGQGVTSASLPYSLQNQVAQGWGQLGNLAGTNYSGQSSGNSDSTTTSNPSPFSIGSGILGSIATIAPMLVPSDERVKENIAPVGKSFDGQTIYRYNYKGEPKTQVGLIAQEVEHIHPTAVHDIGGIKAVNYDHATRDAANMGHFASGGEVIDLDPILTGHMPQVAGTPIDPFRKGYWGAGEVSDDTGPAGKSQEIIDSENPHLGWEKMGAPDWLTQQHADAKAGVGNFPHAKYDSRTQDAIDRVGTALGFGAELTGVPMAVRGLGDAVDGVKGRDIPKAASGVAQVALGAMPGLSATAKGTSVMAPFFASAPKTAATLATLGGIAGYPKDAEAAQTTADVAVSASPEIKRLRAAADAALSARTAAEQKGSYASTAAREMAVNGASKVYDDAMAAAKEADTRVRAEALANAPFRERVPGAADALFYGGLGFAGGAPFLNTVKQRLADTFVHAPAIRARTAAVNAAVDANDAPALSSAQAALASRIGAWDKTHTATTDMIGQPIGKSLANAVMGAFSAFEGSALPDELDIAHFDPGHPVRENASKQFHDPNYYISRGIPMALAGSGAAITGQKVGDILSPRGFPMMPEARVAAGLGDEASIAALTRAQKYLGMRNGSQPLSGVDDASILRGRQQNAEGARLTGDEARLLEQGVGPEVASTARSLEAPTSRPRLADRVLEAQDAMPVGRQIAKPTDVPMEPIVPETYVADSPASAAVKDAQAAQRLSRPRDPSVSQMPEDASRKLEKALGVPEGYVVPDTHTMMENGQPRRIADGKFDSHDVLIPVPKDTAKVSSKRQQKLNDDGKITDPNDPAYWADKPTRGQANGGSVPGYAYGGATGYNDVRHHSEPVITGAVNGKTGGREDALPVSVPSGAFVLPADIVSALGSGNTGAGFVALEKMFGKSSPQNHANGGKAVPIKISDGEFVISPNQVAAVGKGDMESGHRALDKFVIQLRKEHINTLRSLPGPSK